MTFFDLILHNLWRKKARSIGLALAVAIAVMTVVTLAVTSSGLEQSAAAIISVGKADFTVLQKGAADTLSSTIDRQELARIGQTPGVANVVGVLVETQHINADNPVFIEIGINPGDLAAFGVKVVAAGLHADLDKRGDVGLASCRKPRSAGGGPVPGQRHVEHRGGHLLDGELLRGRRRHVPASGHPGVQPGRRDRHVGIRQGNQAPRPHRGQPHRL